MKRYHCTINVFCDEQVTAAFKAGKVYPMTEHKYTNEMTDEFGTKWIVTDWLLGHFTFLEDIPLPGDPYADPEAGEYAHLITDDGSGFMKGCLICFAVGFIFAITLIALIW